MKIYIVMVNDRHADPEPRPFSTAEAAIAHARHFLDKHLRGEDRDNPEYGEQELNRHMIADKWLFYGSYSCEGDSVWVVERTLDQPEEDQ